MFSLFFLGAFLNVRWLTCLQCWHSFTWSFCSEFSLVELKEHGQIWTVCTYWKASIRGLRQTTPFMMLHLPWYSPLSLRQRIFCFYSKDALFYSSINSAVRWSMVLWHGYTTVPHVIKPFLSSSNRGRCGLNFETTSPLLTVLVFVWFCLDALFVQLIVLLKFRYGE